MGHADVSTTMNIYAEANPDVTKSVIEKLSKNMDIFQKRVLRLNSLKIENIPIHTEINMLYSSSIVVFDTAVTCLKIKRRILRRMTSFGRTKVKKTSKSIQVYRIRESPFSKGLQGYTRVSLAIKKAPDNEDLE